MKKLDPKIIAHIQKALSEIVFNEMTPIESRSGKAVEFLRSDINRKTKNYLQNLYAQAKFKSDVMKIKKKGK